MNKPLNLLSWRVPISAHYLPSLANTDYRGHTFPTVHTHNMYVHTYVRTYARTLKLVHAPVGMATSWWITERALAILVRAPNKLGWTHLWGWGWRGWWKSQWHGLVYCTYRCMWGNSQSTFDVPTYTCTYMYGVRTYEHTYVGDMLSTCTYVRSLALTSFQSCSCRCHLGEWKHNPPYPEGVEWRKTDSYIRTYVCKLGKYVIQYVDSTNFTLLICAYVCTCCSHVITVCVCTWEGYLRTYIRM